MSVLPVSVLIIDDDKDVLFSAELLLKRYFKTVIGLSNPAQILPHLNREIDLVLLDMNFMKGRNDGREGLRWLQRIKQDYPNVQVIMMTAYAEVELAVKAVKNGAFDFVTKPWQNEKLLATMMAAYQLSVSQKELTVLKDRALIWERQAPETPQLLTRSVAMQEIKELVKQVAPTDANVLISGENGTGKEVMSNYIHSLSNRYHLPLVKVDLGALPETLFESELFGVKKGAYTDAKTTKKGQFELASKSTLFLDEIGNVPINLQPKLLSAIQDKKIRPIGSEKEVEVDIRFISATNSNLHQRVIDGNFRQDLLYRINTIEIEIPALRNRKEDIPVLVEYFVEKYGKKYKKELKLESGIVRRLQRYEWPGNIRELEHAVERAVIMSRGIELKAEQILPQSNLMSSIKQTDSLNLLQMEKKYMLKALEKNGGNVSKAAKELGLTRTAMYRRMEKHNLG